MMKILSKYSFYGIDLFITDEFLSDFRKQKIDISSVLNENKKTLMSDGILSLL